MVPDSIIGNIIVPPGLMRNPDYPFLSWLMKPYGGQLDHCKEHFSTFRCLQVHWWAMSMRLEVDKKNWTQLIISVCVLHNICETRREVYSRGQGRKPGTWIGPSISGTHNTGREERGSLLPMLVAPAPHSDRLSRSRKPWPTTSTPLWTGSHPWMSRAGTGPCVSCPGLLWPYIIPRHYSLSLLPPQGQTPGCRGIQPKEETCLSFIKCCSYQTFDVFNREKPAEHCPWQILVPLPN